MLTLWVINRKSFEPNNEWHAMIIFSPYIKWNRGRQKVRAGEVKVDGTNSGKKMRMVCSNMLMCNGYKYSQGIFWKLNELNLLMYWAYGLNENQFFCSRQLEYAELPFPKMGEKTYFKGFMFAMPTLYTRKYVKKAVSYLSPCEKSGLEISVHRGYLKLWDLVIINPVGIK